MTPNQDFVEWLKDEIQQRGWTDGETARKSEIAGATLSKILNLQAQPGVDFCNGIARAFKVPPEDVFRRAGLLPKLPEGNEIVRTILLRLRELQMDRMGEEVYLPIVLDFVETLSRRRQAAAAGDRLAKTAEELSALELQRKQRLTQTAEQRRRDLQYVGTARNGNGIAQTAEEKPPYETE